MVKLKLTDNPDVTLPIWSGKLDSDVIYADLQLDNTEDWSEQPDGMLMLRHVPDSLYNVMSYFDTNTVNDNILEADVNEGFLKTWPTPSILDPDFLKSALVCYTKIIRLEPGQEILPGSEDRLLFGRIVVKLDDYLLSPPTTFVGNTDWPATDIVYETDHDYMGAVFYLNSNTFHTAWQNNSKRNVHLLFCELRLEPLFLAK